MVTISIKTLWAKYNSTQHNCYVQNGLMPIQRLKSVQPTSRNDHRVCSAAVDAFRPPEGQKEHPLVNARSGIEGCLFWGFQGQFVQKN